MSDTVNGTIKALEWEHSDEEGWCASAGAGAEYLVELSHNGSWYYEDQGPFADADAAKAAAQADYEARIRSCIATPANATDTAGLDAMMSAGLLDTVRRTAMHPYGETQDYPCDDVKRMGSTIAALQAENERLQAELARMRDRLTSTEFLRPLIQEQSAGEWDDKTIDADVETFAAAIRAALTDSQKETGA